jgi:Golgi nucleoside diphosphatase
MGHIDEIFIFSYFYDRTRELLGLDSAVHEQEHLSEWTLNDLKHLSRLVCYLSYHPTMSGEESMHLIESLSNHLVKHFDSAQALITHVLSKIEQNDHLCFDVRFIHEILVALVGNVDDKKVVIEKRIEGIEVGWCLGWIISWLQQNPEGYEESNN